MLKFALQTDTDMHTYLFDVFYMQAWMDVCIYGHAYPAVPAHVSSYIDRILYSLLQR